MAAILIAAILGFAILVCIGQRLIGGGDVWATPFTIPCWLSIFRNSLLLNAGVGVAAC